MTRHPAAFSRVLSSIADDRLQSQTTDSPASDESGVPGCFRTFADDGSQLQSCFRTFAAAVCNCRSAFAHCGRQSAVTGRFLHLCECRSPGATLPAPGPTFPASVPVRPCTKTNVRAILRIEEDPTPCTT